MIITGKNSRSFNEAKRIYKHLQDLSKRKPERLVNSPFIDIDNIANILVECPDRLAANIQYFLQGIGLISAMPMRNSKLNKIILNNRKCSLSIDEFNQNSRFNSESESSVHNN